MLKSDSFKLTDKVRAVATRRRVLEDCIKITGHVIFKCYDKHGRLKWVEEGPNVVVNEGINYIFNNDLAAATLYVGLIGAGTPAASWTMTEAGGSTGALSDTNGDREVHSEYSEPDQHGLSLTRQHKASPIRHLPRASRSQGQFQ